ncbi:MAG: hypothetical protein ACR2QX_11070 [Woeseiaceae bacterium]
MILHRHIDRACLIAAVAALSACATQVPVVSRLDSSGITVVTLDDALVLSRPAPRLAALVQDYAYIGPVRVNRMGKIDHYLWVGFASTVDREFINASTAEAVTLALVVDGQPMILALDDWSTRLDHPPYDTAAPIYATLATPVSLDQIDRIASATSVEALFIAENAAVARYRMWAGTWATWTLFVDTN